MDKPLGSETVIMRNVKKIMTTPEFMNKVKWQVLVIVMVCVVAVPGVFTIFQKIESKGYKDEHYKLLEKQVIAMQREISALKKHHAKIWTERDIREMQKFLQREGQSLGTIDRNDFLSFILDVRMNKQ